MSLIDSVARVIKGFLLGGLGGLLLPTAWMAIVFNGSAFLGQFTDGTSIYVILTSMIAMPFSTLFQGLLEGGLLQTALFGAASGAAIAVLGLVLRRFVSRRGIAIISGVLALIVAIALVVTQSPQIMFATGLVGAQIWVLCAIYVVALTWLSYWLNQVAVA
jgi:hypothetical protein